MNKRPRILLTRRWTSEVEHHLAERFEVTLNERDVPLAPEALRAAMRDHDAICPTVTDRIDASVLEVPDRRVRLIGNFGVGFNHIDVATAARLGVQVSNTPDVLTDSTAELAILLPLHIAFIVRIVRARGAAARQRAVELESYRAIRTHTPTR